METLFWVEISQSYNLFTSKFLGDVWSRSYVESLDNFIFKSRATSAKISQLAANGSNKKRLILNCLWSIYVTFNVVRYGFLLAVDNEDIRFYLLDCQQI